VSAVARWTTLRDRTRQQLEAQPGSSVDPDVGYEGIDGVDCVTTPDGDFFFDGNDLRVVYADGDGAAAAPLLEELGPGEELRSRAHKRSMLHVWADQGLAASVREGRIDFVEVFPPTSLEAYRSEIYEEPEPHLR
jgi:hypothetical protein